MISFENFNSIEFGFLLVLNCICLYSLNWITNYMVKFGDFKKGDFDFMILFTNPAIMFISISIHAGVEETCAGLVFFIMYFFWTMSKIKLMHDD